MAPASRPSGKKQQSLTSFFTPKTVNGLAASFEKQSRASASPSDDASSRKRPLDDDAAKANETPERTRKKAKPSPAHAETEDGHVAAPPSPAADAAAPPARAGRYLYDGASSAAGPDSDQAQVDEATKRKNDELHRRFVKKLGHPEALSWRQPEDAAAGQDDGDAQADDDESPAPAKTKKKSSKSGKLTPMDLQFLEIKRKHMDTVLIVEVGYKFRFFGEDARIAAKELSIVCIPGKMRYDEHPSEAHLDRFASASIPVHRLSVHAKRLVAAGHKVGVVRQIETAALKKAGDNRNTPFVRKLTSLYTKGTYIDENGELDQQTEGTPSGGYLLSITETKSKGSGTDEKVDVGILAVQPATGDIIYDNFEDGFMRSEMETRLLHISPCEFLIVGDLTKGTDKLVRHLSGSSTNVFGDRSRVRGTRWQRKSRFGGGGGWTADTAGALRLEDTQGLDSRAIGTLVGGRLAGCLSAMISHLEEYGLEHIFNLTKYFQHFSTRSHMLINGTTLESLEVYRNSTDHSEKGSLFWALDKTLTRFGRRLLRKWVGRPLLDRDRLEERMGAVQELLDKQSTAPLDELEKLLSSVKIDLERSLIRIYYGKCTRPELLSVLRTLQGIATYYSVKTSSSSAAPFAAALLASATGALPQILDSVVSYLERINLQAARKDDKYAFFRDDFQTEDMQDHQLGIAHVEHELDAHRSDAAAKIKKSAVEYVTVAGIEYLIEVPNSEIKNVPASWSKISGTKKLSRFHTPEVLRLIAERDQHREALAAACDKAFKDLLAEISADYQPLRDAVTALATIDCLLSLSKVAAQPGYSRPVVLPSSSEPSISISQGRHPIAEHTLEAAYIPFSTALAHPSPLAYLITGPNMGGKSSFVRALALIVLLAQMGSFVPADSLTLTLCDAIHTRTGARDNLFAGESTFMVEVSETARILRSATPRSLVILDELGRGTSTHDGAAIAHAVLQHIVTETRCLTLFITHYQNLARVVDGLDGVKNVHMRFRADDAADGEDITFLYEVGEGVAHRSYGLNVARLARIPKKVLDVAAGKSAELELDVRSRRLRGACRTLNDIIAGDASEQLPQLIASIAQL
ncbi:DNA mismatch repair protein msh3 [Ophiocordyceps sinensis CO18]|uniref:MutS protein homolog 3 n=1 Tax=Ophiocordyceps sinensis (strain Co18 / CGMCC 3.14243) TaxID=911162 RepID=T5AK62_OPHSC|nr:DNA mismatch repair protein msh3 [Ophiocordyceps sinensis CO18]